jgi:hypothetical protein
MENNACLRDVAEAQRSGPKTVLGPGRRCLPPASESYVAPSLQRDKETFVRVQAGPALEEYTRNQGRLGRDSGTTVNAKTVD